ncbi:MAG TPA: hypothetical protein VFG10_05725 [Saprospiraceae bacterium]|nr:hypothetical protein [Saprospiraceae bacterium]
MKNITYLLFLACIGLCWLSCKDDVHIPEAKTGANLRIVLDPDHSTISSTAVATDFISWEAFSVNKDLDHVDIILSYKGQDHLLNRYSQADFNDGSVDGTITAADLAGWFNVAGFADGSRGGIFTIHPVVALNDGRVYPGYVHLANGDSLLNIGTGPLGNVNTGAFTVQKITAILCPPVDIAGSYLVVSAIGNSTDACCAGGTTISGNIVTLTPVPGSSSNYIVSDITGGLYFEWYDEYGILAPENSPGQFLYNCNEVTIVDTQEPFGTAVQGEGLSDAAAGTITYTWANGYGDTATVTLQKQ